MSEIKITKNSLENATLKNGQLVIGNITTNASGNIISDGYGAIASGQIGQGADTINNGYIKAQRTGSFVSGKVCGNNSSIIAESPASLIIGQASGENSQLLSLYGSGGAFIHGRADGNNSYIKAESTAAIAGGKTSGNNSYIYAQGINAIAQGYTDGKNTSIKAEGNGAYACGKVDGENSYIKAKGVGSIAYGAAGNGYHIETSGEYAAHAEGYAREGNIEAFGYGAHAEGCGTINASGNGAHAEGINTQALADGAHAGGIGTTAYNSGMTAIGKYNVSIGDSFDLFVIGGGAAYYQQKNALSINNKPLYGKNFVNMRVGNSSIIDSDWYFGSASFELKIQNQQYIILEAPTVDISSNKLNVSNNLNVSNDVSCNTLHVATGAYQTSDINLKDIISDDISLEKAYNVLEKCHTIQYVLKGDESKKEQIGMIAQEIQEYFPEIISESKDGILSLDYARLSVILFRLVKDLSKKNDDLNNRISIIEEKLKNL